MTITAGRRPLTLIFLILTIITLLPTISHAKDISGKFGIGVKHSENSLGTHISYCLPKPDKMVNVNLGLSWQQIEQKIKIDGGKFSDDLGTLTLMPVMFDVQTRFIDSGPFTPYIGLGIGASFNDVKKGQWADDYEAHIEALRPGDVEVFYDVDDSLAAKGSVGADIFFTDWAALNVEVEFLWTSPKADLKMVHSYLPYSGEQVFREETDYLTQGIWFFGGGMNFYF